MSAKLIAGIVLIILICIFLINAQKNNYEKIIRKCSNKSDSEEDFDLYAEIESFNFSKKNLFKHREGKTHDRY